MHYATGHALCHIMHVLSHRLMHFLSHNTCTFYIFHWMECTQCHSSSVLFHWMKCTQGHLYSVLFHIHNTALVRHMSHRHYILYSHKSIKYSTPDIKYQYHIDLQIPLTTNLSYLPLVLGLRTWYHARACLVLIRQFHTHVTQLFMFLIRFNGLTL